MRDSFLKVTYFVTLIQFAWIVCCFGASTTTPINVYVNTLVDSVGNATACLHPQSGGCNLRSAWAVCISSSTLCNIYLPGPSNIFMNGNLGSLSATSSVNISISGNGAIVQPNNQVPWTTSLIYISTSSVYGKAYIQLHNISFHAFGATTLTGSVLYVSGYFHAILQAVTIEKTFSKYGAIYVRGQTFSNSSFSVYGSIFRNNTAYSSGGAISLWYSVFTRISNSSFINNICTNGYGGAIDSTSLQDSMIVENHSYFTHCRSKNTGSCIYMERLSTANPSIVFRVTNVTFTDAVVSALYINRATNCLVSSVAVSNVTRGLGIDIISSSNIIVEYTTLKYITGGTALYVESSSNATIRHCKIAYTSKDGTGGGMRIRFVVNVTVVDTTYYSCKTTSFVGSSLALSNVINATIDRAIAERGYCNTGHGSSIFLYNVTNAVMTNSMVRDNTGGALGLSAQSTNVTIQNFTAINCAGLQNGGGILLGESSVNIKIDQSTFIGNSATTSGGSIYVDDESVNITIVRSLFENNTAAINGGGISINNFCNSVVIAGCVIRGNSAASLGGGMFINQGNDGIVVQDYDAYKSSKLVQSPHPYVSSYPVNGVRYQIMNATVSDLAAKGFIVFFDAKTNIWSTDTLYVYTVNPTTGTKTLVYSSSISSAYPGVSGPALFIPGQILFFSFLGPVTSGTSTKSDYGFLAYVYPVIERPNFPTIVADNSALQHGGGVYMAFEQNNPVFTNLQIVNNQAMEGDGGGMYVQLANVGVSLWQVDMIGNTAGNNAGGILVANGQFGAVFYNCSFVNSQAQVAGGAMYLVSGNGNGVYTSKSSNMVNISSSSFVGNIAHGTGGGAVLLDTSNIVEFSDCVFEGNSAPAGSGGALKLLQYNDVATINCAFLQNNVSDYGGAIYSSTQNQLSVQGTVLTGNVAGLGGGGISATQSTVLRFCGANVFQSNAAVTAAGGAILLSSMAFWTASVSCDFSGVSSRSNQTLTINGNTAPRGSAVALYKVTFPANSVGFGSLHLNITENVASVGGTVYWVYDPVVMNTPPIGLQQLGPANWSNNVASYGNESATQTLVVNAPPLYRVQVYGSYLQPPISLTIADYYGQLIPLNGTSTVYTTIVNSGPANCSGNFPYLTGPDVTGNGVTFENGVVMLNSLSAYCASHGNITIQFQVQLGSKMRLFPTQTLEEFYVSNTSVFSFRSCSIGEYRSNSLCVVCPQGSYNLDEEDALSCQKCIGVDGIETCYADSIVSEYGYWRRYANTEAVLSCTMEGNCLGGNVTGDASCAVGYQGPLCGVCVEGYFLSGNACSPCNGGSSSRLPKNVLAALLLVICVLVFASACAFYRYVYVPDNLLATLIKENRPISTLQLIYLWCKMKYHVFVVKLKIIAANLQIVSSTANTFKITWPASFSSFTYSVGILNFNIGGIFSFGCSIHYDFFSRLLTVTLLPIILVFIICVVFITQYSLLRFQKRREQLKQQQQEHNSRTRFRWNKGWDAQYNALKNSYLTYIFYLTYFILPMVTTTIFQSFLCTNIDPQVETPGEDSWYLTADLSISCETDYYYSWRAYSIVMIFVYPIGIPAFYFYLLYQQRHELLHRDDPVTSENSKVSDKEESASPKQTNPLHDEGPTSRDGGVTDAKSADSTLEKKAVTPTTGKTPKTKAKESKKKSTALSPEAERLSFLWLAYAPAFWYWEIVETTRRLLLTAVLSVISPGSSAQNLMSLLLALLYVKLYGYFKPYMADADDVLAEIGQFQVFFTFFIALSIQNHMLSDTYNTMLSVLLILFNMASSVITMYQQVEDYQNDMRAVSGAKDKSKTGSEGDGDGAAVNEAAVVTEALRNRLSSRNNRLSQQIGVAPLRHVKRNSAEKTVKKKDSFMADKGDSDDDDSDKDGEEDDSDDEDDEDDDNNDPTKAEFVAVYSSPSNPNPSPLGQKNLQLFQLAAQQHYHQQTATPASTGDRYNTSSPASHINHDKDIEMASFPVQTSTTSMAHKNTSNSRILNTTATIPPLPSPANNSTAASPMMDATEILRSSLSGSRNDFLIDSDDEM